MTYGAVWLEVAQRGAGAVTVHLLVNHPQATLETGTTLIFELTDPLFLSPTIASGN